MTKPANPYRSLREMALNAKPEQLQLKLPETATTVYGVVMDWGIDGDVATLASFVTGDTSLYLSSGGGTVGGFKHPTVSAASQRVVSIAQSRFGLADALDEPSLPGPDMVLFHLLTNHGRRVAKESGERLDDPANLWHELFNAANAVLAELRAVQGG